MALLMPCVLAFPVLPYFEGEGPATPPGLWIDALKDFGLTWSLMLKLPFEVPPGQHGTNVLSLRCHTVMGVLWSTAPFNVRPDNTWEAV